MNGEGKISAGAVPFIFTNETENSAGSFSSRGDEMETINDAVEVIRLGSWTIIKRSNAGLACAEDGHRTSKYDYHIYGPLAETAEEILTSKRAALLYVKNRQGIR